MSPPIPNPRVVLMRLAPPEDLPAELPLPPVVGKPGKEARSALDPRLSVDGRRAPAAAVLPPVGSVVTSGVGVESGGDFF